MNKGYVPNSKNQKHPKAQNPLFFSNESHAAGQGRFAAIPCDRNGGFAGNCSYSPWMAMPLLLVFFRNGVRDRDECPWD